MAQHGFTPMRLGETVPVEECDAIQSFTPGGWRTSASSTGNGRRRVSGGSDGTREHRMERRASAGSDTSQGKRNSLMKLRQSIQGGLNDMVLDDIDEDESSIDEGELLFADNVEEIARHHDKRNKLMSQSVICRFGVSFVVFLNTVVIAAEAMFISYRLRAFDCLEVGFTIFYVLEITFRLYEVGLHSYLTEFDWAWNAFDMAITFLSVVDTVTNLLTGQTSGASVGRLFRIFRILRMFRAMRFLNEVDYVLATAAKATLKLGVVVALCIFVFSIIATNMLWDSRDNSVASMFSSLGVSMWSMFKLMTLDDWVPVSEKVIAEKPGMAMFFVVFIFSTSIALISLVPAIFIEISLNSKSREEKIHEDKMKDMIKRKKTRLLRMLFQLTDFDNNGKISVNEMKKVLTDDSSLRQLQDAGLTQAGELRDVRLGLFDLWEEQIEETNCLDSEISEDDFISGLLRSATDVSQASLWRAVTATRLMLRDFASCVRKDLKDIKSSQKLMVKWQESRDFDKLVEAMRDFMDATRNDLAGMQGAPRHLTSEGTGDDHQNSRRSVSARTDISETDTPDKVHSRVSTYTTRSTRSGPSNVRSLASLTGGYGASMPGLNLTQRLANLLSPKTSPKNSPRSASPDIATEKNTKKNAQRGRNISPKALKTTDALSRSGSPEASQQEIPLPSIRKSVVTLEEQAPPPLARLSSSEPMRMMSSDKHSASYSDNFGEMTRFNFSQPSSPRDLQTPLIGSSSRNDAPLQNPVRNSRRVFMEAPIEIRSQQTLQMQQFQSASTSTSGFLGASSSNTMMLSQTPLSVLNEYPERGDDSRKQVAASQKPPTTPRMRLSL